MNAGLVPREKTSEISLDEFTGQRPQDAYENIVG
jgi:hypothetical protein